MTQEIETFQLQYHEYLKEIESLKRMCDKVRVEGESSSVNKEKWVKLAAGNRCENEKYWGWSTRHTFCS